MKEKTNPQISLFEHFSDHEIGQQLKSVSTWLDVHPDILDLADQDLRCHKTKTTGRKGMSVDSIVRAALLKQMMELTYQELSFHLSDSYTYSSFARVFTTVGSSSLQENISKIKASTWEKINHIMLESAAQQNIEKGRTVRIDSTVTEANIHPPTDSELLWDCIRVMVRYLNRLKSMKKIIFCDHSKSAKKRAFNIQFSRGKNKKTLYAQLIKLTMKTKNYLSNGISLNIPVLQPERYALLELKVKEIIKMTEQVLDQSQRRVLEEEKVPVNEKIVSIFEPHSDIIVKGSRDVQYGHKLNITTGKSGMVLDIVIEDGNPADSAQLCPMIKRQKEIYGRVPRQTAADGGYASKANLEEAKTLGVKDVCFNKNVGLKIEDMVKSRWVYKRLTKFRAGVEGNISCLKRRYGLSRCTWKGEKRFRAFIWASTVAYNLMVLARLNVAS
jgi:transposase, IS5 family